MKWDTSRSRLNINDIRQKNGASHGVVEDRDPEMLIEELREKVAKAQAETPEEKAARFNAWRETQKAS